MTSLAARPPQLSRRSLLFAAAAAACGPPKAQGFRGYCFVANQESRSVATIDLTNFRLRRQIPLDEAPRKLTYRGERDMVKRAQEYLKSHSED